MNLELSDAQLELHRIAGDISLVLEHGSEDEKQSLGRLIRGERPDDYRQVLASYGITLSDEVSI